MTDKHRIAAEVAAGISILKGVVKELLPMDGRWVTSVHEFLTNYDAGDPEIMRQLMERAISTSER